MMDELLVTGSAYSKMILDRYEFLFVRDYDELTSDFLIKLKTLVGLESCFYQLLSLKQINMLLDYLDIYFEDMVDDPYSDDYYRVYRKLEERKKILMKDSTAISGFSIDDLIYSKIDIDSFYIAARMSEDVNDYSKEIYDEIQSSFYEFLSSSSYLEFLGCKYNFNICNIPITSLEEISVMTDLDVYSIYKEQFINEIVNYIDYLVKLSIYPMEDYIYNKAEYILTFSKIVAIINLLDSSEHKKVIEKLDSIGDFDWIMDIKNYMNKVVKMRKRTKL